MNREYLPSLNILAMGLMKRGIRFQFQEYLNGGAIAMYDKDGNMFCDAICHDGSYGREKGLLEIMGELVNEEEVGDTVEGWLTASEVLERVDRRAE